MPNATTDGDPSPKGVNSMRALPPCFTEIDCDTLDIGPTDVSANDTELRTGCARDPNAYASHVAVGIVLIEDVIIPVVIQRAVWIVHPQRWRAEMICLPRRGGFSSRNYRTFALMGAIKGGVSRDIRGRGRNGQQERRQPHH